MKRNRFLQMLPFLSLCIFTLNGCDKKQENIKLLVITGGHDFDEAPFFCMIDNLAGIEYDHAEHPYAHALLKEEISKYDAVLLYDMPQEISKEAQDNFIAMLQAGKGLVVLHHAFCSYESWPEYTQIAGGRYHHYDWEKEGKPQPPSDYEHDVVLAIKVENFAHPITQGISDFQIIDEIYSGVEILPNVQPLLSADKPSPGRLVGWTNIYADAHVVTLLPGHDEKAWNNPAFSQLLQQSLTWAAKSGK